MLENNIINEINRGFDAIEFNGLDNQNITIQNNTINGTRLAVYVEEYSGTSENITISYNTITNIDYGIFNNINHPMRNINISDNYFENCYKLESRHYW